MPSTPTSQPRKPLRVFIDTGALLALVVFPKDKEGRPTLAGEVLELYERGRIELILSEPVVEELRRVIRRKFPDHLDEVEAFLAPFKGGFSRWPTPEEVETALPATMDPADAPIFAAAVVADPKPQVRSCSPMTSAAFTLSAQRASSLNIICRWRASMDCSASSDYERGGPVVTMNRRAFATKPRGPGP